MSRSYAAALRGLALALTLLGLVACASVLGIDERKQDSAANYTTTGYEGCRPGGDCNGCILPEHKQKCLAPNTPSVCDQGFLSQCGQCVCDNCESQVNTCEGNARCAAIWTCLADTRCELLESSTRSCYRDDTCKSVIESNGGLAGKPFDDALAVRVCAIGASCLSCLSTDPEPAPGCTPDNGCQDCGGCFQQCVCTGDGFSACQTACGEEAPPSACSQADECAGCTRCFDNCVCHGNTFVACTAQCSDTCTAATSCTDCPDCVTRCVCNGGSQAACQASCTVTATSECKEANNGEPAACGGCQSCFAQCTCAGADMESCIASCRAATCDCNYLPGCTPYGACLCSAGSSAASDCGSRFFDCGSFDRTCDSCLCSSCEPKYAFCHDTPGCALAFACMRSAGCKGEACVTACADTAGGETTLAFGAAESLWACSQGQGCGDCATGSEPPCGLECPPHQESGAYIQGCCTTLGSKPRCGLQVTDYFPNAPQCVARKQLHPPEKSPALACSGAQAPQAQPYNNACFEGCERFDGSCGVWDSATGLGCMDPQLFGNTLLGCLMSLSN